MFKLHKLNARRTHVGGRMTGAKGRLRAAEHSACPVRGPTNVLQSTSETCHNKLTITVVTFVALR